MNWKDLEATPSMFSEPVVPTTGNSSSCYTCDRKFANLATEYQVRRDFTYEDKGTVRKYFFTYCIWCAFQHEL